MPCAFLEKDGVMRIMLQGAISGQQLHQLIDESEALLGARQQWPDALIDLVAMDASALGFLDMMSLSGRRPRVRPAHHVRLAVVSDSAMFTGAARMLGAHPAVKVELFSTLDAAEA